MRPIQFACWIPWRNFPIVAAASQRTGNAAVRTNTIARFSEQRIYQIDFEAEAYQLLTVETLAPQKSRTDTFLMLVCPTGLPIAADDDSGDGVNAALTEYRLPASGNYTRFITYNGSAGEVDLAFDLSD
jgi:hypothetical protein